MRGHTAALRQLVSLTQQTVREPEAQSLYISYTDCYPAAMQLKEMVEAAFPCREVILTKMGPVVGTHTGPENVCLFSWGSGRLPKEH